MNQNNDMNSIKLVDFHTHLFRRNDPESAAEEIMLRKNKGIYSCFSCGKPEEWDNLLKTGISDIGRGLCNASFGIHPWYSDSYDPDMYEEIYRKVPVIGEIGMDCVWTDIPLDVQRSCFVKQLHIAERMKKPVVLHTKGCEKEIADIIETMPLKFCVHWYSGDPDTLKRFIDMGCFFTLGPDFADRTCSASETDFASESMSAARMILDEVPPNRIFTETDGLESIYWLNGITSDVCDITFVEDTLGRSAARLAERYFLSPERVVDNMMSSVRKFLDQQQFLYN